MRATCIVFLCSCLFIASHATFAMAQLLTPTGDIELTGEFPHGDQLSGVTFIEDLMVVCPDEKAAFYTLKKVDESTYDLADIVSLIEDEDAELELEGAASDDKFLYLVGSHSLRRKTV